MTRLSGMRRLPVLGAAAVLLVMLNLGAAPSSAAVQEGDPATFFLADGGSFACEYALVPEVPTGGASCGSGFAVGAGGTTVAPPHEFLAEGSNRSVSLDGTGRAVIQFSPLLGPVPVVDVAMDLVHMGSVVMTGESRCMPGIETCVVELAGEPLDAPFAELRASMRFPTIVGVFTPQVEFGGPDPSRLELAGTWGAEVLPPPDVPVPVADLPPAGDVPLYLVRGASHCFGLSLVPAQGVICSYIPPIDQLAPFTYDSDGWPAPRNLTAGRDARLHLVLQGLYGEVSPAPGSAELAVSLFVGLNQSVSTATCSYPSLPATCDIPLRLPAPALPWRMPLILEIEVVAADQPFSFSAGTAGDPSSLTLANVTWEPDPEPAQAPPPPSKGSPAPALAFMVPLGLAALRRNRR